MKIKLSMVDPVLMFLAFWLGIESSPWWLVAIPAIAMGWFINPRWDSRNGWRIFRD